MLQETPTHPVQEFRYCFFSTYIINIFRHNSLFFLSNESVSPLFICWIFRKTQSIVQKFSSNTFTCVLNFKHCLQYFTIIWGITLHSKAKKWVLRQLLTSCFNETLHCIKIILFCNHEIAKEHRKKSIKFFQFIRVITKSPFRNQLTLTKTIFYFPSPFQSVIAQI